MRHIISIWYSIDVSQMVESDSGEPFFLIFSNLYTRTFNLDVNDEEFKLISNAFKKREKEYGCVELDEVPGCESLFDSVVKNIWQKVVDGYNNLGVPYTIKNTYELWVTDDIVISPSVYVAALEPQEPIVHIVPIPEKTEFEIQSDGNLTLLRVGRDFKDATFPIERITRIGERAFEGYLEPFDIVFPNCTYVGNYAFVGCIGLRRVNLPVIEVIGDGAFSDCHFLTDFTYPNNILGIKESAFYACMNLKYFTRYNGKNIEHLTTLPQSIVRVHSDAFAYTPLDHLSENPIYGPDDYEKEFEY